MANGSLNLGESFKLSPEAGGKTVAEVFATPADLINVLLPNLMMVAGLLLFFFLVGAGFKMVMNPGDKKAQEEGKKAIGYAIGGFLLLFVSYWIIQAVEIILGVTII